MKNKICKKILCVVLTLMMLMQLIMPQLSVSAIALPDMEEADSEGMVLYKNGSAFSYSADFGKGWCRALQEAEEGEKITIQLQSDWYANTEDGFYYVDEDEDEYGTTDGCLYLSDEDIDITIDLNGYTISRNLTSATDDGHVFWINGSTLTIGDTSEAQTGKITGAYSDEEGGAFYIEDQDSVVCIRGGTICGNKAEKGGAFFVYNGTLRIEGGTITDNEAVNGGGIYWESRNDLVMTDSTITGNKATEHGGGVYVTNWGNVYVGGTIKINDNINSYGTDNVYLADKNAKLNHSNMQKESIPYKPFRFGAYIGVSCVDFSGERIITNEDSGFGENADEYVVADEVGRLVTATQNSSKTGYTLTLIPDHNGVVYVTQEGSETETYTDFAKGWVAAIKKSKEKPTTFKLGGDWYAPSGRFYCADDDGEYGTNNGCLHLGDSRINLTIDLNGYTISRNLNNPVEDGQVFRVEDGSLTIKDFSSFRRGKITGAYNIGNGGAFYMDDGSLYIEGGNITGNRCAGSGAGVYWHSSGNIAVTGGRITENIADTHGGGVYISSNNIYVGGNAVIYDNTGGGKTENVYLSSTDYYINHTVGQSNVPNAPLRDGAVIGISVSTVSSGQYVFTNRNGNSGFDENSVQYFNADEHFCLINGTADSSNGGYKLFITPSQETAMQVIIGEGSPDSFTDFGRGWAYAVEQSQSTPTTIKLESDWYAPGGNFCYVNGEGDEYGTDNGRLYLNDGDINLTIDLNGHTISRNLGTFISDGHVFRIKSGSLTIKDSSETKTGKITGAYNDGDGGAFYMDNGSLHIEGGNITGNKCTGNGAGVYWYSSDVFKMTGGKITDNIANTNGGGIYLTDWGDIYFGGSAIVDGNTGGTKRENVYLSDEDIVLKYTGGQNGSNSFATDAKIGLTCHEITHYEQFTDTESCFDTDSVKYLLSDDDTYFVDIIYDEKNGGYKLSLAYDQSGFVCVTPDGEETRKFYDLGKGWVYALEKSLEKPTTIKLAVDWLPFGTGFKYRDEEGNEYGTDKGRLYLNNSDINLTIDLNGYEIRRTLTEAVEYGDVICVKSGNLVIDDTSDAKNGIITGGNNIGHGGGIYIDGGSLTLKGGSIANNKVLDKGSGFTGTGGGIWAEDCTITIDGGNVSGNKAKEGGGIYIWDNATLNIEGGSISDNESSSNGGGVYCYNGSVVYMRGGTVTNNKAGYNGGGFYFGHDPSCFYMTDGSILRNIAQKHGGGIYLYTDGTVVLAGGVISENHAENKDPYYKEWNRNGGGGVFAHHMSDVANEFGTDPYIGGNIQIFGNTSYVSHLLSYAIVDSNLYFDDNSAKIKQALGQENDVPNLPLTTEAKIGLSTHEERVITDEDSMFDKASLKCFYSDNASYRIDAVHDNSYGDNHYEISLVEQFGINNYIAQRKEAVINAIEAGTYKLIFADYDGNALKNVDVVEVELEKGSNFVHQKDLNITLESGDKIMLLYNFDNLMPACSPLTMK